MEEICTEYDKYQICSTFNNNHTTNKLNYNTIITILVEDEHKSVVEELLEQACNLMGEIATGSGALVPEIHHNSLTNRVNYIMKNNIIYEILKVFTSIYKEKKEVLNDLIVSKEETVDKFVNDLATNLVIKVSNPTSVGGFCFRGLCRNPSLNTVVPPVKPPVKRKCEKPFKDELTRKIMKFFTAVEDTAEYKINMLEKISNLITKRNNVVQKGGVPRMPGVLPSTSRFSHFSRSLIPHSPSSSRGINAKTLPSTPFSPMHVQSNINVMKNMSLNSTPFNSTPFNINYGNSVKQSTPLAVNTNISNIHIDQQAYSPHEFEFITEINDRIQNLENIHDFLKKFVRPSLTVGELLLLDNEVVLSDIKEGIETLKNFVNGQTGGGPPLNNTDMITALYTLDVKTIKYEQMIAYRTYALYTNALYTKVAPPQKGGGIGDFLTKIHDKFASYSFSEKINALQSLGKSLIVYVFQRVLKKLKLPKEIAELSVVEDAKEYFDIVANYIGETYNKSSIITQKYAIYTKFQQNEQQNERQKQINQINIDIIDGLIGFATLINMFCDINIDPSVISDLEFLIDNLNTFKKALKNDNNSTFNNIIQEFKNKFNPSFPSAKEYTSHKDMTLIKKSLEHNLRGFERYDKIIREGTYKNQAQLKEFETYRGKFEDNLGNNYYELADDEDKKITKIIEISQQMLIRIAKFFTAKHLTKDQLDELKNIGTDVLQRVMDTKFAQDSLIGVQTGFAQFITHLPWLNSIMQILNLLAPLATTFGNIMTYANPIGFFILVINLCIVALHYTVRLSIFFWRKYAKKTDFNPEEFLNELKERTSVKQKGGKTVRFVSAKSKTRTSKHTLKGGVGFLPALSHPKSSIQQVHDTIKSTQSSLPSIQGVKLPLIQQKMPPLKQVSDNDDVEILSKIAETIVYDISKYSNATRENYKLESSEIEDMASAIQILITSDTVKINEVYSQSQFGGKRKRTIRTKHTLLQSKTKKELIAHAKSRGIRVKSADKKDDIIKAISIRKYKK